MNMSPIEKNLAPLTKVTVHFRRAFMVPILIMIAGMAGAETNGRSTSAVPPVAVTSDVPAEVIQPAFLFEICRYIYRWQLDERDIENLPAGGHLPFWVRALHPPLDAGDQSRLAEIILPGVGISLRLKKADYTIPELNATVKSKTYKITNVARITVPAQPPPGYQVVSLEQQALLDYLFKTRNQRDYPDQALGKRLRAALHDELESSEDQGGPLTLINGRHVVHQAPLSPVANELWVFWENGRMLLRFASDIDLANPAVWDHESLMIRLYDVDSQVVVSLDEAPGSNQFMTRDQVGRILYNCIVLGRRLELPASHAELQSAAGTNAPAASPPPVDPKAPLGAGAI